MAWYRVIKKGFMNKKLYSPNGKRSVLRTAKPLKVVPSWLERMTKEEEELRNGKAPVKPKGKVDKTPPPPPSGDEQDESEVDVDADPEDPNHKAAIDLINGQAGTQVEVL